MNNERNPNELAPPAQSSWLGSLISSLTPASSPTSANREREQELEIKQMREEIKTLREQLIQKERDMIAALERTRRPSDGALPAYTPPDPSEAHLLIPVPIIGPAPIAESPVVVHASGPELQQMSPHPVGRRESVGFNSIEQISGLQILASRLQLKVDEQKAKIEQMKVDAENLLREQRVLIRQLIANKDNECRELVNAAEAKTNSELLARQAAEGELAQESATRRAFEENYNQEVILRQAAEAAMVDETSAKLGMGVQLNQARREMAAFAQERAALEARAVAAENELQQVRNTLRTERQAFTARGNTIIQERDAARQDTAREVAARLVAQNLLQQSRNREAVAQREIQQKEQQEREMNFRLKGAGL